MILLALRDYAASATSFLRVLWLRALGVRLGAGSHIGARVDISGGFHARRRLDVAIGEAAHLAPGVIIHAYGGRVTLGRHIFVGPSAVIYGHGGVTIGDDALISMHCCILSSNHAIPPAGTIIRSLGDVPLPTKIGRDVWLGAGVTVLGGVTIGDGCVVGAGAVVTHDLPPNSIAVGIPARVTGTRA